eukprot:m.203134 g.203134  ORF g.203134 m.203134 type:complete len:53 (+) comp14987_c2_seq1:1526-1684(+)
MHLCIDLDIVAWQSLEQVDSGSDMDSSPEDHVTHPVTKEAVPLSSLQRLYIL